ncbi:protein cornichon homolog 1 isoform X1 [Solanum verrucosum]|uniref:protein cornichon homolog 1 isoform X1 n=1 Tax=Solanum verrucosum TaxID=315347 RepID=UPI0020D0EA81|nr:protein cornichon homolog 1 isoform X1 [Solanum verrucosum]
MSWEPILWLIFLAINISLISLLIYQIVCLTDLEADYMNPYESSSRINSVVLKEYILHGAFCILFLVTGHWFIFLLTLLPAYYNVRKFLSRQHLIDVTEVFRFIESEKKIRILKLGFYLVLFVLVLVRISNEGTHSLLCYQFSHPLLEILTFSLQFLNSGQYLVWSYLLLTL